MIGYQVKFTKICLKIGFSGSFVGSPGCEKTPLADVRCLRRPGPVTGVGVKCPELAKTVQSPFIISMTLCVWRMVCCFPLTPLSSTSPPHHYISSPIPHYLIYSLFYFPAFKRTVILSESIACHQQYLWLFFSWNTDKVVIFWNFLSLSLARIDRRRSTCFFLYFLNLYWHFQSNAYSFTGDNCAICLFLVLYWTD